MIYFADADRICRERISLFFVLGALDLPLLNVCTAFLLFFSFSSSADRPEGIENKALTSENQDEGLVQVVS